jgi:inosose dehydratase
MQLTRRGLILGSAAAALAAPERHRLIAHAYIFVQDAQRRKVRAVDEVDRICGTIASAGFKAVEFMSDFFEPEVRARTISAVRTHGLTVPIVYVGGAMHEPAEAAKTRGHALDIAESAREAGLTAINTNPSPKPKRAPKTEAELAVQAKELNALGETLGGSGLRLLYHTHDPEMAENAREWRHVLKNTDPKLVSFCLDTHWIHRGGQRPVALLREAGKRTASLHVRNSRKGVWSPTFEAGDVNHAAISAALKKAGITPDIVVELAYEKGTAADWDLGKALTRSRAYAQKTFEV